jgi:hypothetical protein
MTLDQWNDSRREGIVDEIKSIKREKTATIWAGIIGTPIAFWLLGTTVTTDAKAITVILIFATLLLHEQICNLRIDGFARELRDLPPRQ